MSGTSQSPARDRVDRLSRRARARWGLPAEACRVHGYLYLVARPVAESELSEALKLSKTALADALAWLADYRLIERVRGGAWRTGSDPWDLMMRALAGAATPRDRSGARCAARIPPRRFGRAGGHRAPSPRRSASCCVWSKTSPPSANRRSGCRLRQVRQMVGLGGMAARLLDRTFLGRSQRR